MLFNHFWVYSSVTLNTCTFVCSRCHHASPDIFHPPHWNPTPIKLYLPTSPLSPGPSTTVLLSVSINLTTLSISNKCNHTVLSFNDWLISLSTLSSGLSYKSEFLSFVRLNSIPLYVYSTFCLSVLCPRTLGLLPWFGCCEQCCSAHDAQIALLVPAHNLCESYQQWSCWWSTDLDSSPSLLESCALLSSLWRWCGCGYQKAAQHLPPLPRGMS